MSGVLSRPITQFPLKPPGSVTVSGLPRGHLPSSDVGRLATGLRASRRERPPGRVVERHREHLDTGLVLSEREVCGLPQRDGAERADADLSEWHCRLQREVLAC